LKDWALIQKKLRKELIDLAHSESITYYDKVAFDVGINYPVKAQRQKLFDLLIEIGDMEHKAGRPLINSLVLNPDKRKPGSGFYQWWSTLTGIPKEDLESQPGYLEDEHKRCFVFWGDYTRYDFYR
jgi:hypothetical protein